jgi:hypothetical protein
MHSQKHEKNIFYEHVHKLKHFRWQPIHENELEDLWPKYNQFGHHIAITIHPSLSSFTSHYTKKEICAKTTKLFLDNIQLKTNINVNISDIHNFQLQAQQLPSHQLNTNLILVTSNIPQNFINTTHEDGINGKFIRSLN